MTLFKQNCIVKWVIFLTSSCWLWDFLLEHLKLKKNSDHVHWYARNDISKKESQIWVFESFIFWSKVHFLRTSLGFFSQFFFLQFFVVGQPWWPIFLLSPPHPPPSPHHKKASYGPDLTNDGAKISAANVITI